MAQVKFLKLVNGVLYEMDTTADEITLYSGTFGAGGLTLTGGGNLTAGTGSTLSGFDSIEGIASENLLDKTANETITGAWKYNNAAFTLGSLDYAGVQATLTVGTTGTNAVIYTAKTYGKDGNSITVEHIDPGTAGALSISVVGNAISVTLAHDGTAVTSTAPDVASAINADANASALVSATYDGTGIAAVIAATNLSGGKDDLSNIYDITIDNGITLAGTALTATFAELNQALDGISANVTSTNLNTLTGGATSNADALHTHTAVEADVTETYTAGAGGIAAGQVVYVSAADTILPASATADNAASRPIGIAESTIPAGASGKVTLVGCVEGVGTGWTPGKYVYLDTTAGAMTQMPPSASGNVVVELGIAKNATDLQLRIGERKVVA